MKFAATGDTYVGEWASGRPHGAGSLRFADGGGAYDGAFVDGVIRGAGRLTTRAGVLLEATFEARVDPIRLEGRSPATMRGEGAAAAAAAEPAYAHEPDHDELEVKKGKATLKSITGERYEGELSGASSAVSCR